MYWKNLSDTSFTEVDIGNAVEYDLTPLNLVIGTRYEFYVTAYSQGSTSGESDHIKWPRPADPIIIEIPEQPRRLVIEF